MHQRFASARIGLGTLHELVATRRTERIAHDAAELGCILPQLDPHDAASSARDSRIRCTSVVPDATVADTE